MIIDISKIDVKGLSPEQIYWLYNGLDSANTIELVAPIKENLSNQTTEIYELEKSLQAPALEMMLTGILIDQEKRTIWLKEYQVQQERLEWIINQYAKAIWFRNLNPGSYVQLQEFFYTALRIPKIWKRSSSTGKQILNTDANALKKIKVYRRAKPIVTAIEKYREVTKIIGVLKTGIDSDGIFRTSFNIAGTETGRWSSSTNAFGTGSNVQNITAHLREIFIARPGRKLAYIDLEQAESNIVAHLAGDEGYIAAHKTGDPHTVVARMIWPELPWTGELASDRALCDDHENPFYRHFTHRDMSKKGQHGTNYYGTPRTMGMHLKVPTSLMEIFQTNYFKEYPGIPRWHEHTAEELMTTGTLTTPFGRSRTFFSRLRDDATLREAIAFIPQSTVCDYLNHGILNIWRANIPGLSLLAQVHDALLIEYPEEREAEIIAQVRSLMTYKIPIVGIDNVERITQIETDALVGWNWGYASEANPNGLVKWRGKDERKRAASA